MGNEKVSLYVVNLTIANSLMQIRINILTLDRFRWLIEGARFNGSW